MSVRIFLLLFLVLCVHVNSYAQFPFYQYFSDSIRPGYRISGNFDSIDVRLGNYQSSLPMLNQRFALETFNPELLSNSVQNQNRPARYSSIPHVGLQYSFGSNLSQKGGISYTQALTPNQFIQLDYTRLNSNGVLRNSAYEINHVDIRHLLRKAHYASQTDIVFDGSLRKTNGGLVGDSIDPDVTLQFNAVEKEDASVTQRYFHTEWRNFFSFTGDSLLKTGVFITPRYQIENRRYEETGDILSIYGVANINAGFSNDYWERSEIGATGGYFFHTSALSVNAGFGVKYWDFDNLIRKSDTVETMLSADLAVNGPNRIRFTANGAYTLSGATGENHLAATLSWQPDFADIAVNASFKQAYPANYQRAYYANALNYSWVNRQLSTVAKANASVRLKNKWLPLIANASFSHLQHMPFFIDSNWRQDTLTAITVLRVALRADLHVKKLFFQPSVAVQQSDLKFVPVLQAGMRMGFDGFLFKAKKLRATFGTEIGYTSSFTLLDYVPMMDTYVLPASVTNRSYEAMIRLHVFSQFELGFFRWYLRVENIEQTFLKTTNQEALGYPVLPLQIRIGMSWDLFN